MMSVAPLRSVADLALSDAENAFGHLRRDLIGHGVHLVADGQAEAVFEHEGCQITLAHGAGRLRVAVTAPNENTLFFLKEAAARHLLELDPLAAAQLTWSDPGVIGVRPGNFREMRLVRRERIMARMVRLTFAVENLGGLSNDGLHVKFLLPPSRNRAPLWPTTTASGIPAWPTGADRLAIRFYTLRRVRPSQGEIFIDVVLHGNGRVSSWAETAQPGDLAGMLGPGGGRTPRIDGPILLSGDLTAAPAIARMIEELPETSAPHVWLRSNDLDATAQYLAEAGRKVRLRAFTETDCIRTVILEILQRESLVYAWFAGEHDDAQIVRKLFKTVLKLPKGQQQSVAYWRRGQTKGAEVIDD
jgi:NADPH-dependent ferric siderophore reductase